MCIRKSGLETILANQMRARILSSTKSFREVSRGAGWAATHNLHTRVSIPWVSSLIFALIFYLMLYDSDGGET